MAARANWKGYLKIDDFSCAVGLYSAIWSSDWISLNIINNKTHNRVERRFMDSETGKPVLRKDQVKGYRLEDGEYGDKTILVESFIDYDEIDKLYFDKPYDLAPAMTPHKASPVWCRNHAFRQGRRPCACGAVSSLPSLADPAAGEELLATTLNF